MDKADKIASLLVKSGYYVNANKTKDKIIKTPNGDIVPAYLSCRLAISNVKDREKIEEGLVEKVKEQFEPDVTIVGMATAGITWAHAIAQNLQLPLLYIRSSEKEYGLKGLIEGDTKNTFKKVIIVDDVLYTGNTIKRAQEILKENNFEVVGVACIATLRDKIVSQLNEQNIQVADLTNYRNILEKAVENNILDAEEYKIMKDIYEEKI